MNTLKVLLLTLFFIGTASADGDIIPVISRSLSQVNKVENIQLTTNEKAWLADKRILTLAVPSPDNPPLDITLRSGSYEGVTADVIGILSKILDVTIVAKRYATRSAALQALKKGEVDMLGAANTYEAFQGFLLTKAYISDKPVLYIRQGVEPNKIESLAVPQDYLPLEYLNSLFADKKVSLYPGRYSALASVAYEKNDVVLIDMLSGNFLVNKFYQDNLTYGGALSINSFGFSFALSRGNNILKSILDKAISVLGAQDIDSIYQRWSGGGPSLAQDNILLSEDDVAYLKTKGNIIFSVNGQIPPISFIDLNGQFRGMVADLIQIISARTGIVNKKVVMNDVQEQLNSINSRRADLTVISPDRNLNGKYYFTRAFALDPLVFVIRKDERRKYSDIKDVMASRDSIALVKNTISEKLVDEYDGDNLHINYFDKYDSALSCVALRLCGAALIPLRPAQFFINSEHADSLTVGGELYDSVPISVVFAGRDKKLVAIIDKIISSIPSNELEALANRWRISAKRDIVTFDDVVHEFWLPIVFSIILLVSSLVWTLSLRIQYRHKKQAERNLKNQLKFMDELVDSIPHPIFARDDKDIFVLCNKQYCDILGLEREDIIGKSINDMPTSSRSKSDLREIYNKLILNGSSYTGDHVLELNDGQSFQVYYWLQTYKDLLGNTAGIVGGWLDISDRHQLMEQLSTASQKAEEASRAKSTFLATMSHEIRTPMNAIIGLLELTLRKGGVDIEAREAIEIVYQSAKDLLVLIGDILDISKIESGKLELSPAPHSLEELSRGVLNVFSANAREKGIQLVFNINEDKTVMIDAIRYKQIVSNLISNAIKFTKEGKVELSLEIKNENDNCHLQLKVVDTGVGISKVDQAALFQPFSQVSDSNDETNPGTGLGLMICKSLCVMMGGELELSSALGEGTVVSVSLKLPVVSPRENGSQSGNEIQDGNKLMATSHHILVIDDHPTNRLLVSQQLGYLGHSVSIAISGKDALKKLESQSFDVIITDFNMPDIDGLEFTSRYRQQEKSEKRARSVIIGLTADARQEQLQSAIGVGMDDCLFKPVTIDELQQCLATHINRSDGENGMTIAKQIENMLEFLSPGNNKLMWSLLQEFVKATDDDILALSAASENNDHRKFCEHLHRIKGAARIIGAKQLLSCCNEWENSPRLNWCMPSALRQVQDEYVNLNHGIVCWKKSHHDSIE